MIKNGIKARSVCRMNSAFWSFLWVLFALSYLTGCQSLGVENTLHVGVTGSPMNGTSIGVASLNPSPVFTETSTLTQPSSTATNSPTFTPSPSQTSTKAPTFTPTESEEFTFVVNGDSAYHSGEGEFDTPQYFRGMAESIAEIPDVAFLITAGDTDPPWETRWTIDRYLGKDFLWFPAVGNHEVYADAMHWLREYQYDPNGSAQPNIVNRGPSGCEQTTYAFDYGKAHFAVLNVYCDVDNEVRTDGAIVDHLYDWLKLDLENTKQELIFVVGHEPAFPQLDEIVGVTRHLDDSLDKYPVTRDRFWDLLKQHHVVAYITGHTHSYSIVNLDGVWQVDVAHSMGARTQSTRSTYIVIHVNGRDVTYETYRVNNITEQYELINTGALVQP